jgi:hypothetical protein
MAPNSVKFEAIRCPVGGVSMLSQSRLYSGLRFDVKKILKTKVQYQTPSMLITFLSVTVICRIPP